MPYIKQENRVIFSSLENEINKIDISSPGELNYLVTLLIKRYCSFNGNNYRTYNDIMGALTGANLEFYRRIAVDYENLKIKENGDVYST